MRPSALISVLLVASCSTEVDTVSLELPDSARTMILILEDQAGFEGSVHDVRHNEAVVARSGLLTKSRAYVLVYDASLTELDLLDGPIEFVSSGDSGRPLPPDPTETFTLDLSAGSPKFVAAALPPRVATLKMSRPTCLPVFSDREDVLIARDAELLVAGVASHVVIVVTKAGDLFLVGTFVEPVGRVPDEVSLGPMVLGGGGLGWFAMSESPERLTVGRIDREGMTVHASTVSAGWTEPLLLQATGVGVSTATTSSFVRVDGAGVVQRLSLEDTGLVETARLELPGEFLGGKVGSSNGSPGNQFFYSEGSGSILIHDGEFGSPELRELQAGVSGVLEADREFNSVFLIDTNLELIEIEGDTRTGEVKLLGDTALTGPPIFLGRIGGQLWFVGEDGSGGYVTESGEICAADDLGQGPASGVFRSESPASLGIFGGAGDLILHRLFF